MHPHISDPFMPRFMKSLSITLMLLVVLLFSCKSDPTKDHPQIKQMESEAKAAMNKLSLHICKCLYEHPTAEMIKTAKVIITAQDDKQKGIEEQHLLKPVLRGMGELKACMEAKELSKAEDLALQKDLRRLLAEDEEQADQERLDIILAFLGRNCADSQALYKDFIETVEMLLYVLNK
jgi:hypothetical protein